MADITLTVKPSGGDYTTLAGAIAGALATDGKGGRPDLTSGGGSILNIAISGTWSSADTAAVVIDGFTTSATCYVNIYTDTANRANMPWSTSKYILAPSAAIAIDIEDNYVTIDGLQVAITDTSSIYGIGGTGALSNGANRIVVSNCVIKGPNTDTNGIYGIANQGTYSKYYIFNCIVYGFGTTQTRCVLNNGASTTMSIYNSTIIGGAYGMRVLDGTVVAKNVYCGGSGTEDFNGTITETNCASEDATAGGTNHTHANVDTDTFVNVTYATADFHLAADGLSPLEATGIDTTGDAVPMNFTTDIDGELRQTAAWDIGADGIAGEGAIELTVANASDAHTAGAVALTQHQVLALANASDAVSADNVALTQHQILALANASSATLSGTVGLTQHQALVLANASSAQTASAVVLGSGGRGGGAGLFMNMGMGL